MPQPDRHRKRVLGVFSGMGEVGGVERSAREAWLAIDEGFEGPNHVINFCAPLPVDIAAGIRASGGVLRQSRSAPLTLMYAFSQRWPVDLALFWHVGLLKLRPFIRSSGAKTALFLHGVEAWRKTSPLVRKRLRQVDLFLTNSDFTWEQFLGFHPDLRSADHLTVPLGLGQPLEPGTTSRPLDPPSALMIGRVAGTEAYKGHDAVIAAWPAVQADIPGAKLRIVGPCDMKAELMDLARKRGVADAIEIAGTVTEVDKHRFLAESRCMALPSRAEGFGLAYIESMRMGRPCLVSTLDAGREVVCPEADSHPDQAAGLAVDPADSTQLAAALIRLMTPGEEWERWSANATERYAARYTAAHFRARLVGALAGIL